MEEVNKQLDQMYYVFFFCILVPHFFFQDISFSFNFFSALPDITVNKDIPFVVSMRNL